MIRIFRFFLVEALRYGSSLATKIPKHWATYRYKSVASFECAFPHRRISMQTCGILWPDFHETASLDCGSESIQNRRNERLFLIWKAQLPRR